MIKVYNLLMYFLYILGKLSKPSEHVKEIKIEELKYDNLMNRTIDETINNWKLELETQTEIFNNNSEKIKNFEFSFIKNFDNVKFTFSTFSYK